MLIVILGWVQHLILTGIGLKITVELCSKSLFFFISKESPPASFSLLSPDVEQQPFGMPRSGCVSLVDNNNYPTARKEHYTWTALTFFEETCH